MSSANPVAACMYSCSYSSPKPCSTKPTARWEPARSAPSNNLDSLIWNPLYSYYLAYSSISTSRAEGEACLGALANLLWLLVVQLHRGSLGLERSRRNAHNIIKPAARLQYVMPGEENTRRAATISPPALCDARLDQLIQRPGHLLSGLRTPGGVLWWWTGNANGR